MLVLVPAAESGSLSCYLPEIYTRSSKWRHRMIFNFNVHFLALMFVYFSFLITIIIGLREVLPIMLTVKIKHENVICIDIRGLRIC